MKEVTKTQFMCEACGTTMEQSFRWNYHSMGIAIRTDQYKEKIWICPRCDYILTETNLKNRPKPTNWRKKFYKELRDMWSRLTTPL
jgi:rubrerythrin